MKWTTKTISPNPMLPCVVEFGEVKSVGPWWIRADLAEVVKQSDRQPYLTKKAVPTLDAFMKGKIEYYVEASTIFDNESRRYVPQPLVFRKFTKVDRPQAWKQCDLRIQSTLPLLGNDESVDTTKTKATGSIRVEAANEGDEETVSEPNSTCLVRISLEVHNRMVPSLGHLYTPVC